jgi:integrase
MATIRKRTTKGGAVRFHVQVRLKGHPPETASFERKTDARRWAQDVESAIRNGRHFTTTEAKRHTLGELIDRYLRDVLPGKRETTQIPQRQQLAWWKAQLGGYALIDITPATLAEQRDRLGAEDRSPATVTRYLAALSHALTVAVKEWGWLEDNPLRKVTKPKEPRGRMRFLADDERERLLSACRESENPFLYTAVVLALSTGARRTEIWALRWPDVDLQRGVITLHETKNGERRVLPLVGHAHEQVKEHARVRRLDTDLLFPSHRDPEQPIDLRKPWETALQKAGIADFRWHDLRHSCASYLAMNDASLAEIAEVLGHKTLAMVKRYSHLSDQHVAGVVAKMNQKIFGGH